MRGVLRGTRVSRLRRCEAGLKPGTYTIQNTVHFGPGAGLSSVAGAGDI